MAADRSVAEAYEMDAQELLDDLRGRLNAAYARLSEMADDAKHRADWDGRRRLLAKRSGVALAQDYLRAYGPFAVAGEEER